MVQGFLKSYKPLTLFFETGANIPGNCGVGVCAHLSRYCAVPRSSCLDLLPRLAHMECSQAQPGGRTGGDVVDEGWREDVVDDGAGDEGRNLLRRLRHVQPQVGRRVQHSPKTLRHLRAAYHLPPRGPYRVNAWSFKLCIFFSFDPRLPAPTVPS